MAKKMMPSSLIHSISILIMLLIISDSTSALDLWWNYCPNTTMFGNNTKYESNLSKLFNYLTTNATTPSRYHQASVNDSVYGHFLCRYDMTTSACQNCVTVATTQDIPIKCLNRKNVILWYDTCLVRYSNQSFFGTMDAYPGIEFNNVNNITGNVTRYEEVLGNMMNNVIAVGAAAGGQRKFSIDSVVFSSFQKIYGMGMCTPDISQIECNECLVRAFDLITTHTQGGRILVPSCFVRYEIYPLFDLSLLASPPQSLPSQQPPPSPRRFRGMSLYSLFDKFCDSLCQGRTRY